MGRKKFLTRLAKELPDWVVRLGESQRQARQSRARDRAARWYPAAHLRLSILGVLLFGSGIVTCFAANWGKIPKLISDPEYSVGLPQT